MNIVIVESAAKAKTINKYLGANYKVIPSYGHVRDLPAKDGSVLPDKDFEMSWEVEGEFPEGRQRDRQGGKGSGAADPRNRPGSRRRGHFLAPA